MRHTWTRWARGTLTLALLHGAGTALAAGSGEVDQFFGSYHDAIPIQLPPFHGIEPKLALRYDSSGGNGFVGVGWSLSGFSVIERASRGKGAPNYDGKDIFLLDGQELVSCYAGSASPSCTTGGTHATKIESYFRIALSGSGAGSRWTITTKDGTKSIYVPIHGTSPGPDGIWGTSDDVYWKWGLSQVVDASGNTVSYSWNVNQFQCCWAYPVSIAFNGIAVSLSWETRLDMELRANGPGFEGLYGRVKTIDVQVSGSRVRAYKLAYTYVGANSRSVLTSVQLYGRDATIDSSGTVTGGTALPPTSMQYQPGDVSFGNPIPGPNRWVVNDMNGAGIDIARVLYGDFNGDGRMDIAALEGWNSAPSMSIYLSNGDGTFRWVPGPVRWIGGCGTLDLLRIKLGDFNGDGKTDIAAVEGWNATSPMSIYLSNGDGTFRWVAGPNRWVGGDCGSAGLDVSRIKLGDFNGDGKIDIAAVEGWNSSSPMSIYLSNGDGTFTSIASWATGGSTGPTRWVGGALDAALLDVTRVMVGDFNGDGKMDIAAVEGWGNAPQMSIYLSNGDGTFNFSPTGPPAFVSGSMVPAFADVSRVMLGDFNGDGKTDILRVEGYDSTAPISIFLSTGNGTFQYFAGPNHWYYYGCGGMDVQRVKLGDFNGDGKIDIAVMGGWGSAGPMSIYLSQGNGTFSGPSLGPNRWVGGDCSSASLDVSRVQAVDFTGDGKADFAAVEGWGNSPPMSMYVSAGPAVNLLSSLSNGLGGTTTIQYTPSSSYPNQNNPPIVQLASTVTTSDGRKTSSSRQYWYAGGLWDSLDRRFLGFSYANYLEPMLPGETRYPLVETWFRQDYGTISKPYRIERSTWNIAGKGPTLTVSLSDYASNGATVPYTSLETGHWEYVFDGSGGTACPGANCRRTYVGRTFDGHGNVATEVTYGDYDVSGDEKTVTYQYVPNSSAFIVGKTAVVSTYDGVGTTGALLTRVLFYYDGSPTWNAAPTAGKPTQTASWLDTTNGYVMTSATYDQWGNLTSETDAVQATTRYTIDPTYHQFITATTNALGQTTTAVWDPVCSAKTSVTDLNGRLTTTTHDQLCRLTGTYGPLGAFETRAYAAGGANYGNWLQSCTPAAQGSDSASAATCMTSYLDGLSRVFQINRPGPTGYTIYEQMIYDARGNLAQKSLPIYWNEQFHTDAETMYWLTNNYDPLDRLTRVTYPDGVVLSKAYGLGSITATDELGHVQTEVMNAYGRVIQHLEYTSSLGSSTGPAPAVTTYQYDARGNLAGIIDPLNNRWSFTYDSLGRKTQTNDPDAGRWSYTYDAGGRLTSQTDAKGQRTTFAYDLLGRKISKQTVTVSGVSTVTSWIYDEARSGYCNVGHLTSSIDPSGADPSSGRTATYNYDALGRSVNATRTIGTTSYTTWMSYDAASRLLGIRYPDGDVVGDDPTTFALEPPLAYDRAGRPLAIPGVIDSASYDARGGLLTQTNHNHTVTTRSFSPTRLWVNGIATTGPTSATAAIQSLSFARDAEGKITRVDSPFAYEGWTYGYDDLHRLTSAINTTSATYNQAFAYDVIGNITSNSRLGSYIYGSTNSAGGLIRPHAVTRAGMNTYSYDANGNMVSGAGRSIEWDADNRPTTMSGVQFVYDGDGQRVKKIAGSAITQYLGDAYEVAPGGTVTKYLSFAGVLVAKRVGYGPNSATYWLHTDHQGSVQVVTDASGLEVQRQKYHAYGDRLETTTGFPESRGYTAQRQDETDLFYLHARYYDPLLARFISPDPTVPSSRTIGLNRYAYAGDDPINHTDVNGMNWFADAFHWVSGALGNVGREISTALGGTKFGKWAGGVVTGGAMLAIMSNPLYLATGDVKGWAKAEATCAIIAAGIAVSVLVPPSAPLMLQIGIAGGTGFVTGASMAAFNGGSFKDCMRAGMQGALMSAGTAAAFGFLGSMSGTPSPAAPGNWDPSAADNEAELYAEVFRDDPDFSTDLSGKPMLAGDTGEVTGYAGAKLGPAKLSVATDATLELTLGGHVPGLDVGGGPSFNPATGEQGLVLEGGVHVPGTNWGFGSKLSLMMDGGMGTASLSRTTGYDLGFVEVGVAKTLWSGSAPMSYVQPPIQPPAGAEWMMGFGGR